LIIGVWGVAPKKILEMALYSELPVFKATYDLLLAIFRFTKDFGKEYKYTVGESLKKETIDLLTLIYRANVKRDKQDVLLAFNVY
jgi:hypothetical protein